MSRGGKSMEKKEPVKMVILITLINGIERGKGNEKGSGDTAEFL